MALNISDVCPMNCFKKEGIDLRDEINKLKKGLIDNINTPILIKGYKVNYCPVGNYPEDPIVIISGKTPSDTTQKAFIKRLRDGQDFYTACFSTIYANMRENLYKYLEKIRLFDYLATKHPYWVGNPKDKWENIFKVPEISRKCGIQLTQACNCAIFNDEASGKGKSAEPKASAFFEIEREYNCLFRHFKITNSTKLIIFLDTPSKKGNKFHPCELWNKHFKQQFPQIRTISITHPSRNNQVIYNSLDNLYTMKDNSKKTMAIKLFEKAQSTIQELIKEG